MAARVLVVGSGGREHALAWKLNQSRRVAKVLATPGNDAMAAVAKCLPSPPTGQWGAFARDEGIDLVIVGPEAPLVAGLTDELRAAGVIVFGPSAAAARLEGDKAFSKQFMHDAGVPTAQAQEFHEVDAALAYLDDHPGPRVVKATGLAAGKGVSVCDDADQAKVEVQRMLGDRVFGDAGASVLLEERLSGPELSVFAVVDGTNYCWFAASRDHKRLRDDDAGPNTGGMGAYTPVADATEALMQTIDDTVLAPSVTQLRERDLDYRGLLYVGLMLTPRGPMVLEYNCRFGDPETQVVLPTFNGDLFTLLDDAARGRLRARGQLPQSECGVGIVLASAGYPENPRRGDIVSGDLDPSHATVFHAGTQRVQDEWKTSGGRVLCVVSTDASLSQAHAHAMEAARGIHFAGSQWRRDIARHDVELQSRQGQE